MRARVAILLSFATLLVYTSSPALDPAAVECVSDSTARSTLTFVRNFMTSPDSSALAEERAVFDLPRLRESQLGIVTARAVCDQAAEAYEHRFGPGASLDIRPVRIVVVEAGDFYFVENLSPGEGGEIRDENFWEIQLFTSRWKPIVSFGAGS